jgi:cytochrome c-type biogenesis protein CcmF
VLSIYSINNSALQTVNKVFTILVFLLISLAFIILVNGFLADNFLIKYVAGNSNSHLPAMFKFAATWGGHEGSMLLWIYILSIWALLVSIFSKKIPLAMLNIVLAVLALIIAVFLAFLLWTSNPFELLDFAPQEGRDLNPLLQDVGLIIHPPMLYMGYVGMSVPFAFIIASLITGRFDSTYLRWSRPWTLIAFASLTFGIVLGSWWAYYELGWGGWWFWDPVENASFMPWLASLALIHSLSVSEKRSSFKHWSVLLAISAFSLSLLGTFLVRSGVLTSVHSFAADPERGVFILIFLAIMVLGSLGLYILRANTLTRTTGFKLLSKETLLLINNILVIAALFAVFLGTLFPLFLDALSLSKISVGEPYFNAVFVPIMLPAVIIMALGSFVRWKSDNAPRLITRLAPVWVGVILTTIVSLFITTNIYALIAIFAFIWVVLHSIYQLSIRLKNLTPSFVGMLVAHIGVGVFVLGATISTQFGVEKDIKMALGDSITINDASFEFAGVSPVVGPNYSGYRGEIIATSAGEKIILHPEKRNYLSGMPMTEAGIDPSLRRDLFVALGTDLDNGAWSIRIYYKPLVRLIWLGGLLIMFGAIIAAFDRRYRIKIKV